MFSDGVLVISQRLESFYILQRVPLVLSNRALTPRDLIPALRRHICREATGEELEPSHYSTIGPTSFLQANDRRQDHVKGVRATRTCIWDPAASLFPPAQQPSP